MMLIIMTLMLGRRLIPRRAQEDPLTIARMPD